MHPDSDTIALPSKATAELCGDEIHRGLSCTLRRGHTGDHECHSIDAGQTVRWKARKPG